MFDISKLIQIFIEDLENQIRKKDFPDKVEYLNKIIKIQQSDLLRVQSSFFEGIRLTYKARRFQKANNFTLFLGVILFFLFLAVSYASKTYALEFYTVPVEIIILILCTFSILISIVTSFLFVPLKNTIFKLFGEIDLYYPTKSSTPKATQSTARKPKTNGK